RSGDLSEKSLKCSLCMPESVVADTLLHIANALSLLAFVFRDVLFLRVVMVVSSIFMIGYGLEIKQQSLAGWELLFLGINAYHIVLLLRERRPVSLPTDLKAIHETIFKDFRAWDF